MKKNTTLICVLVILLVNFTYSQLTAQIKNSQVKGVYLTHEGFKKNEFSCSLDKLQKDAKIKLNQFFISPEISCVRPDKETVFYKDSVFAIQLTNGENFRFVNRNPCLIADTSFLYIYTYKTIITEDKMYGPTRRAKEIPVTYYYFSSGEHNVVYSLTVDNLYKYLIVDSNIKVAINQKFINDEILYSVSQTTGRFVLNEFLLEKINKN